MLLPNILDLIAKYSGNTYIDNKKPRTDYT